MLKFKYVVVHSGARDYYSLSKSIWKLGALKKLITDLTLSIDLGYNRTKQPLPRKFYKDFPFHYFFSLLRLFDIDQFLSKRYAKYIKRISNEHTRLIIYSYYVKHILLNMNSFKLKPIVFQVHPDGRYVKQRLLLAQSESFTFKHVEAGKIIDNEVETTPMEESYYYDFNQVSAIICSSSETMKSLRYSGCQNQIFKLPYYSKYHFDIQKSSIDYNPISSAPIRLVYVGNLSLRKGIFHFLDKLICYGFNGVEVHICTRDSLNLNVLKSLMRYKEIILHYNKNDSFVKEQIINSHFLILPSFVEGFGLTLIEAISLNTPILATENTAIVDFLEISEVGISYKDYDSMAYSVSQDNTSILKNYNNFKQNCKVLNNYYTEDKFQEKLKNILTIIESEI